MAGAAVIAYIIGEGLADAAGAKGAVSYSDGWDDGAQAAIEEMQMQKEE